MDYTIKQGDTLSAIAARNNTTVQNLASTNNIANPNKIAAGFTIKIPTNTASFGTLTSSVPTSGEIKPTVPPVPQTQGIMDYATMVNSAYNVPQLQQEQQTAQTNYNDIISQYKANMAAQENKGADRAALEQAQNISGITSQAKDLTDQILANKTQAQVQQLEKGKFGGLTQGGANVVDAQIDREAAVKNLTLGAQLAAVQGNYAMAQDNIERAINAKYAPLEAKNANLEKLLSINSDILSKADAKALEAQKTLLLAKQKDLETQKENDKEKLNLITKAAGQGAPADVLARAEKATTPVAVAMALGQYSGDYIARKKIEAEISKLNAEAGVKNSQGRGVVGGGSAAGGKFANDLDAILANVNATIPSQNGKVAFQQALARARDDADRINTAASVILSNAPAAVRDDFKNQATGLKSIDKAIALIDSGVQSGVFQAGAQYTYNLAGKDFDPKLATLNQLITSAIQPYRNSITGAAWGEQEDGEYNSLFGSTKYSPAELKQRLLGIKDIMKTNTSEGLNVYVNPMNTYSNPFNAGYSPDYSGNGQEDVVYNYDEDIAAGLAAIKAGAPREQVLQRLKAKYAEVNL